MGNKSGQIIITRLAPSGVTGRMVVKAQYPVQGSKALYSALGQELENSFKAARQNRANVSIGRYSPEIVSGVYERGGKFYVFTQDSAGESVIVRGL